MSSACARGADDPGAPPATDGPLKFFGQFGVLLDHTSTDTQQSFGTITLCSDSPVVITGATAVTSVGGATVSGWGHRLNPIPAGRNSLSVDERSVAELGFDTRPFALPVGCRPEPSDQPEVAIQVQRGATPGVASFVDGVRVSYTFDGQRGTVDVPWRFGWCGAGNPEHCPDN